MSQAIFGLVGVLLGGFITTGSQWLRDRHVRRRERLMAARLVASELGDAEAAIKFALKQNRWWPNELRDRDWRRYGPVLAALIDRLVHHATMIGLKGKSYRLRERGAGVVPAAQIPAAPRPRRARS